jgi:lipoprotein-releasing system permease protein
MAYALKIGFRYLRSKKRRTVSVITIISITGVALGVAALLSVLSITSGFQREFRNKVLGVNAHVLVMKYGIDFDEYRDVIDKAREMPEVAGAGPFLINEMMLAKGDRLSGVLVKGVDPEGVTEVLDLPSQIVKGDLEGLRGAGAMPPVRPEDLERRESGSSWDWLEDLANGEDTENAAGPRAPSEAPESAPNEAPAPAAPSTPPPADELPSVETLSPDEVNALFGGGGSDASGEGFALPDDAETDSILGETEDQDEEAADTAALPGIVVGITLAENLGLEVGDRVTLVSPLSGLGITLVGDNSRATKSRDYRVIAVFEAGFQEYDSRLVYVDLYEAQHFYGQGDSVTGVELRLHDLEKSADVARKLERRLGGPFHTLDWAELNRNLFTALELQKIMLSLVIATIIFVAAFNVIATLIMVVMEKKREIAILKAMGATDFTILLTFMVQGVVIGVIGTLLGLVLGGGVIAYLNYIHMPLDPNVYLIDHLPVVVTPSEFVITALTAFVICALATLAPSWWAARMLPVDGLRYE